MAHHQRTYGSPLNRPDSAHHKNDLKIQLSIIYSALKMDKLYVDVLTRENLSSISVTDNDSFIGQFVYPVGGEG